MNINLKEISIIIVLMILMAAVGYVGGVIDTKQTSNCSSYIEQCNEKIRQCNTKCSGYKQDWGLEYVNISIT